MSIPCGAIRIVVANRTVWVVCIVMTTAPSMASMSWKWAGIIILNAATVIVALAAVVISVVVVAPVVGIAISLSLVAATVSIVLVTIVAAISTATVVALVLTVVATSIARSRAVVGPPIGSVVSMTLLEGHVLADTS